MAEGDRSATAAKHARTAAGWQLPVIVAVSVGIAATVTCYVVTGPWNANQWQVVSTWWGDGVTLAAVVAAFRTFAHDRADTRARVVEIEERELRQQAARVAVWIQVVQPRGTVTDLGVETIFLQNASELPIYDVVVEYALHSAVRHTEPYYTVGPTGEKPVTRPLPNQIMGFDRTNRLRMTVSVTFRDAADQRWRRDEAGRLAQLVDEEL